MQVAEIVKSSGKKPHLSAILVGNDGPSETYVNAKVKACERVGFKSTLIRLDKDVSQDRLIREIDAINKDPDANIFRDARFGVVGDWEKVLPALTQQLKELM